MKKRMTNVLDKAAKANGYGDRIALLMDYGFMPTVLTPKHKKIEIIRLFLNQRSK